ncbi:hypothetical protein HAZT_HAZT012191, partial [Hyalella azteca]
MRRTRRPRRCWWATLRTSCRASRRPYAPLRPPASKYAQTPASGYAGYASSPGTDT